MQFKGQISYFIKDRYDCIFYHKKNSKARASLEQYLEHIQLLEKEWGAALIKSYIINHEDIDKKYIWCSNIWRTDLNQNISTNHQKYITHLFENYKELKFIGPYKSMRTKGLHLCRFGHEWLIPPIKVKHGEKCPKCKIKTSSNGEKYISQILVDNNVEFLREVPLNRFGLEQTLRIDFLVCQNNFPLFVIEFNGVQHFRVIKSDYFGGYQEYRKRKQRDKIKRDYCWGIGLPVVDIPYSETDEQIEETVLYFLRLFELISENNSNVLKYVGKKGTLFQ
jgi:hypothetical protein